MSQNEDNHNFEEEDKYSDELEDQFPDEEEEEEMMFIEDLENNPDYDTDPSTLGHSVSPTISVSPVVTQHYKGHSDGVMSVCSHPYNKEIFVTGSIDDHLNLYSINNEEPISSFDFNDTVSRVVFGYDGKMLGAACLDNTVKIFTCDDKYQLSLARELEGPTEEILVKLIVFILPS